MQPDPSENIDSQRQTRDSETRVPADAEPGPRRVALERRVDGKLWLVRAEGDVAVEIVRCFPWTSPRRYLSLRNAEGEEQAFVSDAAELDAASRLAVDATLARSSFVLEIARILAVEEDFELRSWRVETAHGPRTFQTPLDGWPRELDSGGLVVEDVYGDLYRVTDPDKLDPKSKRLLWAFVD
ncbi:MAG TPA: DUF1854 domain-containing protein [Polyangiaceae bacterium]|jgi:hypothetical protein|nr:DUF1854 domain-containing protein [Polyangiaceae bacterium]